MIHTTALKGETRTEYLSRESSARHEPPDEPVRGLAQTDAESPTYPRRRIPDFLPFGIKASYVGECSGSGGRGSASGITI